MSETSHQVIKTNRKNQRFYITIARTTSRTIWKTDPLMEKMI